jgi:hypothetical protein
MASEPDVSTPQARRWAKTDARLREALGAFANDPSTAPTVAALARAARVGRNIIYTHHAGVLATLRGLQAKRIAHARLFSMRKPATSHSRHITPAC